MNAYNDAPFDRDPYDPGRWEDAPRGRWNENAPDDEPPRSRIKDRLIRGGTAIVTMEEPPPLIEGILPVAGMLSSYGPPKSLKSFVELDRACRISMGMEWAGRAVQQGPVIYCALEGPAVNRARVEAWCLANNVHPDQLVDLHLFPGPLQISHSQVTNELIEACIDVEAVLCVVDTAARAMAGLDENGARDMGLFIASLDRVRAEARTAVGIVHHTGKDITRGARGSNSLLGAVDAELSIERTGNRVVLTPENLKWYREGPPMLFQTRVIELGNGSTNLVVDYQGPLEPTFVDVPPPKPSETTITELLADLGDPVTPAAIKRMSDGLTEKTVYRALKHLVELGVVTKSGTDARPLYTLTKPDNRT